MELSERSLEDAVGRLGYCGGCWYGWARDGAGTVRAYTVSGGVSGGRMCESQRAVWDGLLVMD